ncbi:hypothetical protein GQ457_15G000210 [Hibiscus cannabinus]
MDDPDRKFTSLFRTRHMERAGRAIHGLHFMDHGYAYCFCYWCRPSLFWFYLNQSFMSFDHHRCSSYERLMATGLNVISVLSPLYINKGTVSELESDEQPSHFGSGCLFCY